jgi:hypothetical protein
MREDEVAVLLSELTYMCALPPDHPPRLIVALVLPRVEIIQQPHAI